MIYDNYNSPYLLDYGPWFIVIFTDFDKQTIAYELHMHRYVSVRFCIFRCNQVSFRLVCECSL